jgi:hypothetical protein
MSGDQVRIFNAVIEEDHKNMSGLPVGDVRTVYFHKTTLERYYHVIHTVGLFSNTVTSPHFAQL